MVAFKKEGKEKEKETPKTEKETPKKETKKETPKKETKKETPKKDAVIPAGTKETKKPCSHPIASRIVTRFASAYEKCTKCGATLAVIEPDQVEARELEIGRKQEKAKKA